MSFSISPRKASNFLIAIVIGLTVLHVSAYFARRASDENSIVWRLAKLFDFGREQNLPTLYAVLTLLLCAGIMYLISKTEHKKGHRLYWLGLTVIFAFLAFDEFASFHERVVGKAMRSVIETSGVFLYSWTIPYLALLATLVIVYARFIFQLPARVRKIFILSTMVFVSGAAGMEAIEGWYRESHQIKQLSYEMITISHPLYFFFATLEETLEKLGVVMLIHGLVLYLSMQTTSIRLDIQTQRLAGTHSSKTRS